MKILRELVEIRKELQNIRAIWQSQFVKDVEYEIKRENGKRIGIPHNLEDPLGDLRKQYNINQ